MQTTPSIPGILHPELHAPLWLKREEFCEKAGIDVRFLSEPLSDWCNVQVVAWAASFHQHSGNSKGGLLLHGKPSKSIVDQMQALCAALMRNYLDARVVQMQSLAPTLEDGTYPLNACLCIPNFSLAGKASSGTAAWRIGSIYGFLTQRYTRRKQTVLYTGGQIEGLENTFGPDLSDFLKKHYYIVKV